MIGGIDTDLLKEIRLEFGYSVMDIKNALVSSNNNKDVALNILKNFGDNKRKERKATCGAVSSYVHGERKVAVIIEVNCETDFVARTDDFKKFVKELMLQIVFSRPDDVDDLMNQKYIRDEGITIRDLYQEISNKTKENIVVKRFMVYELGE